jgi:uncharacterized protein YhaN
MRIDRLDLTAFGPFTDVSLDLSAPGLHLVYGPNEAGKSSALRAIKQFFQGFPPQSSDDFIHKYDAFRVGMCLRDQFGAAQDLVRRKGRKNTLLSADGKAIDDADEPLRALLGGVAAADYLQRFVIDHRELVEGGAAIVAGRGELGEALFSAATGLVRLGDVRKSLEEQAEKFFKPRGQKQLINQDLSELDALRKQMRVAALKSSDWRDLDESRRAHEKAKTERVAALQDAERTRNRLIRFRDAREPIARRRVVLEHLGSLADVPRLGDDFTKRRRDAEAELRAAERDAKNARAAIEDLTRRRDLLEAPDAILAEGDAIAAIYRRLGAAQQSVGQRARLVLELATAEGEARAALRALGHDTGLLDDEPALDALRLQASDRALVLDLSREQGTLIKARENAEEAHAKHAKKRAKYDAKQTTLAPERDPAALRKTTKRGRDDGTLEDKRDEALATLKREVRRAEKDLAALGLWTGTLDAVEALAVPFDETVERFRDALDAINAEIVRLQKERDALETSARAVEAQRDRLRIAGDVPTEAALADARSRRDALWAELKAAGQGGTSAWDGPIPAAFETAIRQADEVSDRLRREADRVAERATLEAEQSRVAKQLLDLDVKKAAAQARLEDERTRWFALWSPIGIREPHEPKAMLAWLRRHAAISTQARKIGQDKDSLQSLEDRITDHRRALSAALVATGEKAADDPESLADLLDRAEEVVNTIKEEASARKKARDEQDALDQEQPDLEEQLAAARANCERWDARWSAAMARIGRPAGESPSLASAALEGIETLFRHVAASRGHRDALARLALEADQFATHVRALAARVGIASDETRDPEAAATDLHARLGRARTDDQNRVNLAEQVQNQQAALRAADDAIDLQRDRLETLCREARCESPDDLPALEDRARERARLDAERTHLDAELHRLAAGAPLAEFLDEAEVIDPDTLNPEIERLSAQITDLGHERDALLQTIGGETAQLEQLNKGESRASEIGQQAEDLRARIKSSVDEYARLRLASAVLRAGIERYREKTREPVMQRAESLFEALTLRSFRGLEIDYNERDEPVLRGIRGALEGPSVPVDVAGMSLGTADQLYLALRLATLEAFLDRHEPLPLIVDDILIQFDDERTRATLKVLSQLAERTQVLVFTHHEHIHSLAERVFAPGTLEYHRLPGRAEVPA